MANSEKIEDDNYINFNIKKIKFISAIKTEIININKLFVLKDGKILISGKINNKADNLLHYVFDIKNNNIINLKLEGITGDYDIIQMDDGIICILHYHNSKIFLIDIKEKDYEIVQIYENLKGRRILKLLNQKIMVIDTIFKKVKNFIYENRKLISINE